MESEPLVLTLDFGTQSVRALIIDKLGNTLACVKEPYEQAYFSIKTGYCEQYPSYYWDKLCKVCKKLTKEQKELMDRVKCISMTCFRDTSVLLDENNEVIRPAILWLDQRLAEGKRKLPLLNRFLFKVVGMTDTIEMNMKRTAANWIQENEPENWAKTKHYVNISTYFVYRLVGDLVDSIGNQTGHYPIDFKHKKWYGKHALKQPIFGVSKEKCCRIVEAGDVLGRITKKCSEETGLKEGLVLIATGADKACETIGTGCLTKDMASISYGTASSIEVSNKKYIEPEQFLPSYPAAIPNLYNMEVQVYRGYWMITWFTKEFAKQESAEATIEKLAVEEYMNKKLLEVNPGCDGLVLQPYWGPGLKKPNARGAIIGFSDCHTLYHLYRAIIEGIAYALRDGLEGIERRQHAKVKEIAVSGGGSQSDAICQITADIFGVPVFRVQTYETASLGCAIVGYKYLGVYNSYEDAVKNMVRRSKIFYPNMDNHEKYDYLFKKVYLKMFGRLSDMYVDLKKFSKKYSD